jgi:DNA-binding protein HU-beta
MAKKPLTKSQIASKFAEKFDLKKKLAGEIVDYVAELAYKETRNAGVFTLPGIGKLVLSKRKARKGFNPATGEQINIPAKTVVKMRIAKACKEAILKK